MASMKLSGVCVVTPSLTQLETPREMCLSYRISKGEVLDVFSNFPYGSGNNDSLIPNLRYLGTLLVTFRLRKQHGILLFDVW